MYDTVITGGLILTLEPGAAPLPDGWLAVQSGKIVEIGTQQPGEPPPPARETLDAGGCLVLPGLVNTHCHAPMVWFRGWADDLPLLEWLQGRIFPAESRWLTPERIYAGALLAGAEMLRGGITTVADGYFFEAEVRRAWTELGLRAVTAQGLVDFPTPDIPDPRDNLRAARDFLATGQEAASGLITSALFAHSPYTCSPATLKGAKALTREFGVPLFLHLAETRQEVEELRAKTGLSPAAYLERLGLLDELTVAVHGVWLAPADLELLARRGVKLSHCPESNLKLAAGVAPVPEMLARGLTVGLGTDGAASNNNLDLFGEMSLAARLHKVWRQDPTVLPARQVAALATREGAKVLNLGDRIGTLTPGKEADLIVLDLHRPHLTPLYDPFSHLVYAAGTRDVKHVMVGGRWLLKDRQFLTVAWPPLARLARDQSRDLRRLVPSPLSPP
jgi:5-methylthioadenosine/S-adenosylhomocysteine deaminase